MSQNIESDNRHLPSYILSTRSVLNPINKNLQSFGNAIVFAHHPTDWNASRWQPAKKERLIQHGLDKIKYPVLPFEIPNLENKLRIRINLLSFDHLSGYRRYAIYISKSEFIDEINLFYFDWRYAWTTHFFRLFYDTIKSVVLWILLRYFIFTLWRFFFQ